MTSLAPRLLSTKAETLRNLAGLVQSALILPQVALRCGDWWVDRTAAVETVQQELGPDAVLIVRSSARSEDTLAQSNAGAFASILNVTGADELDRAVDTVIASYGGTDDPEDVVLVQPMLRDVALSGVAFTHDPSTKAPYRVISLHRGTDTTSVTAGEGDIETHVLTADAEPDAPELIAVVRLLDELETLVPDQPLDIEFACDTGGAVYLLQVRALVMPGARSVTSRADHRATARRIAAKVAAAQKAHPYLCGQSTVFGVMPDWNPAEIIGTRPRPLALSLYRNLVTDATWAYQRNNYGYRNLRSFPLLQSFAGQPYIDVRLSFNSFIPADLDEGIANRLVDHYISRLVAAPTLHDKIEFEIVFSCYTLDLPERIKSLEEAGFSKKECGQILKSLRRLTNRAIDQKDGLWRLDAAKIETLKTRHDRISRSDLAPQERIYWLLEDCKRYGTLPFAGLARAGFMAVQLLRSLVTTGVFTETDYHDFMRSVDTVSGQLARDSARLDQASFLARYGHLRPGTYDIRSPRYDEAPDLYLDGRDRSDTEAGHAVPAFGLSLLQMRRIREMLVKHKLRLDVVELMEFLHVGIEQREYAKFVFSRNLSDALAILSDWGESLGFSADDLSYAQIGAIQDLSARTDDPAELIGRSIEEGRRAYAETRSVWLPPLITRPEDVHAFQLPESEPNFVTQSQATGAVVQLRPGDQRDDLEGAIVFIQSADPGYDWLFSRGIAGLVTEYGGVNSHMAIRAGELRLPAVIGAGELLFRRWSRAQRVQIDCAGRRVEKIA